MRAAFDVTSECNLRCKHCYNAEKYFKNRVTQLTDFQVIEAIEKLAGFGCEEINFLGGEPLLRENIIDILSLCKEKKIVTSLTTNGLLINQSKFKHIFEMSLIDNLIFSLDGNGKEQNDLIRGKGSFDKLMQNLSVVKELKQQHKSSINVSISNCLIDGNIRDGVKTIKICKDKGINSISFSQIIETGNALKNSDICKNNFYRSLRYIEDMIIYSEKNNISIVFSIEFRPIIAMYFAIKYNVQTTCPDRHIYCGCFHNCIYIKANGDILPCGFVEFKKGFEEQEKGMFSEENIANIKSIKNFNDIYKNNLFIDFINSFNYYNKQQKLDLCQECPYKSLCQPCSFQNKNNEIYNECKIIYPLLKKLIKKSESWKIHLYFSNDYFEKLFPNKKGAIIQGFLNSKESDYVNFLLKICNYEKKGLLKISRGGRKRI